MNTETLDDFEIKIQELYDDFINEKENYTSSYNSTSTYMDKLFYELGSYLSTSVFPCPPTLNIDDIYEKFTSKYNFMFCEHLIRTQTNSSQKKIIEKDVFYKNWKAFIKEVKNKTNSTAHGNNAQVIIKLISECTPSSSDVSKKEQDFWKYYITRSERSCKPQTKTENDQKQTKAFRVPEIPPKSGIYENESIFYYLLYTFYYYHTFYYGNDDRIRNFSAQMNVYKMYNNINNILMWCISCFTEWYSFSLKNDSNLATKLFTYISGIPLFLEHFGFYWHLGLSLHENTLVHLFKGYKYETVNPSNNYLCFSFPFANDFLLTHRLYSQILISVKSIFNEPKRDEIQQHMSLKTNYLINELQRYFLIPQKLISDKIILPYLDQKSPVDEHNSIQFESLLELCARELFSTLLLALSETTNNLLSYYITEFYLTYIVFILTFDDMPTENPLYQENYSQETENEFLDKLWDYIYIIIGSRKRTSHEDLYELFIYYFNTIMNQFPFTPDEWESYVKKRYLISLDSLIETTKTFDKFQ